MPDDENIIKEPEQENVKETKGLYLSIIQPFSEWADYIARLLVEPSHPDNVDWFDKTEKEEEKIVVWDNPSIISLLPYTIVALIAYISIPVLAVNFESQVGVEIYYSLLFIPLISFATVWQLILLKNEYFIITTHEIVKKTGVISTNTTSSMYSNVQNAKVTRSVYERVLSALGLFNIGDITIFTAGTNTSEIFLDNVVDPEEFKSQIKRFVTTYTMSGSKRYAGDDEEEDKQERREKEDDTIERPQLQEGNQQEADRNKEREDETDDPYENVDDEDDDDETPYSDVL